MTKAVRTTFLLALCATFLASCGQTDPPVDEPDALTVTEISGTLPNWPSTQAFITLLGEFSFYISSGSDGTVTEAIEFVPPFYQGTVSAEGAFQVELTDPDPATLRPLGCTASDPAVALIGGAIASTVPTPTAGDDVIGFYAETDPSAPDRGAAWIYATEAYEAEATCTAGTQEELGVSKIDLALVPGWNLVIVSESEAGIVLRSGVVPDSFTWSEVEF